MRVGLASLMVMLTAPVALAQPADCPALTAPGPSVPLSIDLAGQRGMPAGVSGRAHVAVPWQAPQADCGDPSAPADVLGGEPGDLLRGTPAPSQR